MAHLAKERFTPKIIGKMTERHLAISRRPSETAPPMIQSIPPRRRAFSILELLVVISIIAILASFTIPAASTMMRGSKLTQASQLLSDHINLARQIAQSKNRVIEVRFYRYSDPEIPGEDVTKPESGKFRAFQSFEISDSGTKTPLNKVQKLPLSVIMQDGEYSSILKDQPKHTATDADPELSNGIKRQYDFVAFHFLQDGSTNLQTSAEGGEHGTKWFITLLNAADEQKKIGQINFFTLQIDPVSGTTKHFRPNAG